MPVEPTSTLYATSTIVVAWPQGEAFLVFLAFLLGIYSVFLMHQWFNA